MIDIFTASKYLCSESQWTLSNLKLQKILYLSQMIHMGRTNGERLVDTSFEAWDYGPVSPALYKKMKAFGSKPIPDVFKGIAMPPEGFELQILQQAKEHLFSKSASDLVGYTHQKGGAWDKNYIPGIYGITIPDPDILDEYRIRYGH